MTFNGHIEVGADGFSFANAFSHPHEELSNVEGRPRSHLRPAHGMVNSARDFDMPYLRIGVATMPDAETDKFFKKPMKTSRARCAPARPASLTWPCR